MGREGRELVSWQEVAVRDLVAKGRARDPGHSADVVPIVTGHLHAAEAGQAARDLQDHALGARDTQLRGWGRALPSLPCLHRVASAQGRQVASHQAIGLHPACDHLGLSFPICKVELIISWRPRRLCVLWPSGPLCVLWFQISQARSHPQGLCTGTPTALDTLANTHPGSPTSCLCSNVAFVALATAWSKINAPPTRSHPFSSAFSP